MTMRDLRAYTAPEREPTRVGYRDYEVFGMGPPSSGGSTVGEALNILERVPLGDLDRIEQLHWFLEASRFSFADRNAYLADPGVLRRAARGLLSDSFAERAPRADRWTTRRRRAPSPPGDPYGDQPAAAGASDASHRASRPRT